MDASLAVVIKEQREIRLRNKLCFGAVSNRGTLVWRMTQLGRAQMLELKEQVVDISVHADAAAPAHIIPFDVDTRKLVKAVDL